MAEELLCTVSKRSAVADEVVEFELSALDGSPLPEWAPGAHVEVQMPSGLRRNYSLCGNPSETTYQIAVLFEADGRGGSREMYLEVAEGTLLTVSTPRNNFALVEASRYLFVGGGIGITPILSMVRAVSLCGRQWNVVYGGRTRASMAYLDELTDVCGQRLRIIPEDELGRPDLHELISACSADTAVYVCGPPGLIEAVRGTCDELGLPAPFFERFTASGESLHPVADGLPDQYEVVLARTGCTLRVRQSESILESVRGVVPGVPFSCGEGYCGSCETSVIAGMPDHRDEVLTEDLRESNETMMICVSGSKASSLTLDL